jgi:chitodextrinase
MALPAIAGAHGWRDKTPPSTPTGLTASATSHSRIKLAWGASSDRSGVAGYRVLRDGVQVATTRARAYVDRGLSAATRYTYRVAAFDRAGNFSAPSSPASATTRAALRPRLRSALGTNLDAITYWSAQVPFVDVMKSSSEWVSGTSTEWDDGRALDLDANGWVRSLAPGQVARTLMLRDIGERYPGGRYLVRYKGEGTLGFGFAAAVVSERPGEMVIEVTPDGAGIHLWIEATNPANYLREVEVLMPGGICEGDPFTHALSAQDCGTRRFVSFAESSDILFYPVFASRLRGYSVLRFMDWMRTNNSSVATWAQRTPITSSTWTRASGAPVEVMIALANLVGAHPWFTLPHRSDEAYARRFARLVKRRLDPALGVYVEHSNEVWNSMFTQYAELSAQSEAQGLFLSEYHALRTRMLAGIFKAELGAGRVIAVLGAQTVNTWIASHPLDFLRARFGAGATGIDAVAIAPYFGVSPGPAEAGTYTAMGLDAFFDHVRATVLPEMAGHMANYRTLAADYGVRLLAYEGGQHMVGVGGAESNAALNALFDSFNRDPRIGQLYLDYLADWKSVGGELFVHFNDVSRYTQWGRWGALEYVAQPRSESPKFDALQTFIEQNPVWWTQ